MKKLIAILASLAVLTSASMLLVNAAPDDGTQSPVATPLPTSNPGNGTHSGGGGGAGETDTEEESMLPEEEEILEEEVPLAEEPEIPEELLLAQEEPTDATDYSVVDEIDYTTTSPQTGFAEWDIRGL